MDINYKNLFNFSLAYQMDAKDEEDYNKKFQDDVKNIEFGHNIKAFEFMDALAAKLLERVNWIVSLYNPVPLLFDMGKGELGKTIEIHRAIGGKVYERAYGGYIDVSDLKTDKWTVTTKPWGVHFKIPNEKLKTGVIKLTELNAMASAAILQHKVKLAIDTLNTAYPTTSSYYTAGGSVALTETVYKSAVNALADRGSADVAVFGRWAALSPLPTFTSPGFSDSDKDELHAKGIVGRVNGAQVVVARNYSDPVYGISPLSSANLYLVDKQRKFNRFVEVGGIEKVSYIEPTTGQLGFIFKFEDGAAVFDAQYGQRIGALG